MSCHNIQSTHFNIPGIIIPGIKEHYGEHACNKPLWEMERLYVYCCYMFHTQPCHCDIQCFHYYSVVQHPHTKLVYFTTTTLPLSSYISVSVSPVRIRSQEEEKNIKRSRTVKKNIREMSVLFFNESLCTQVLYGSLVLYMF